MIDLSTPNEWQHLCPDTGLVMPWYTKPALDEIVTWDLKDKVVFEYGCGASTLWWAAKGVSLAGTECNFDYWIEVSSRINQKNWIIWAPDKEEFINAIELYKAIFDIIIIDCDPVEWRDDCVTVALECLKPGGKLILDNYDQSSVWMPKRETKELLKNLECKVYKQSGHPDWCTAVFIKS